jgi:leucyl aminopeptidase
MLDVRLTSAAGSGPLAIPVRQGAVPAPYQTAALEAGFTGAADTSCVILGGNPHSHVILAGLGADPDRIAYEHAGAMAAAHARSTPMLTIDATALTPQHAAACAAGACLRAWCYDRLRTRPPEDPPRLHRLDLLTSQPETTAAAWAREKAAVTATIFARDLVTEPSDSLTPAGFVERLEKLADHGVSVRVLSHDALRAEGFGGLLAVGQGSVHRPCLVVLHWAGRVPGAPIAFVGKGITFDTGGICIKPADKMWEMRADMAGAAACAGAMLALALRRADRPAIAILALAENAISGSAYRPGDVIRSYAGTTVEVIDTDAEGRLVLMDALAYAVRQDPCAIIDLATLTGSVVTALGHVMAGGFDNNALLAEAVIAAGAHTGQPIWRLPIGQAHRDALDSAIADLRHCSPETLQPDACIGAAFLREFVGETPWVHLDIGGVEYHQETTKLHQAGASGFGVRLLDRLADQWPI